MLQPDNAKRCRLSKCSTDASRRGNMRRNKLPIIGLLFCESCDAFTSYKCISKTHQLGEKKLQTKYGTRTLKRYEKIMECKRCKFQRIKISYE